MRVLIARTTLIVLLLISTMSIAQPVKKGVLVVRRGDATQDANYDKDERDPNGKLMRVSVQCNAEIKPPATSDKLQTLIGQQQGYGAFPNYANSSVANSTCFINADGNVQTDPQPGNPNHCLINSVKIGVAKGCFKF